MDSTLFRRRFFFFVFIVEFHAKEILVRFDYLNVSGNIILRFYFSLDAVSTIRGMYN